MIPGTDLIGNHGEGAVDGVHLDDLGMERQARVLFPIYQQSPGGGGQGKPRGKAE